MPLTAASHCNRPLTVFDAGLQGQNLKPISYMSVINSELAFSFHKLYLGFNYNDQRVELQSSEHCFSILKFGMILDGYSSINECYNVNLLNTVESIPIVYFVTLCLIKQLIP